MRKPRPCKIISESVATLFNTQYSGLLCDRSSILMWIVLGSNMLLNAIDSVSNTRASGTNTATRSLIEFPLSALLSISLEKKSPISYRQRLGESFARLIYLARYLYCSIHLLGFK